MIQTKFSTHGFHIAGAETCDFSSMDFVTTDDLLTRFGKRIKGDRMIEFVRKQIQIDSRYFAHKNQDALDLARQALQRLLEKNPEGRKADFLIYAGISSPMPTVCLAALLCNENEIKSASSWDVKSGCSTGVLALQQATEWFGRGAKSGIIVAAETLSKFTNPDILQMSLTIGDGAAALFLTNEPKLRPLAAMHGTDSEYFRSTLVPGKYPVNIESYKPEDYKFVFSDKGNLIQALSHYWGQSLAGLLSAAERKGEEISYYFAHQVDSTKNREFALSCGIPEKAVLNSFQKFGNIGCPSVFLNFCERRSAGNFNPKKGDLVVFQAVGGGLSWASLLLERTSE